MTAGTLGIVDVTNDTLLTSYKFATDSQRDTLKLQAEKDIVGWHAVFPGRALAVHEIIRTYSGGWKYVS